jgi:HK97 family phage portal protein
MKLEKLGIPPNDSQFLESRQFQIPEIARWFNLPPHKLKDLTKSSFSNIESEQISFVTDSILPWLVRLEQNYNMQLLTASDKSLSGYGRLYFKHNFDGLLRADATARANLYRALFNVGGLSINQILAKEEMDPIDDEFADEHWVPMNMIPLSLVKEYLEKNAGKPPVVASHLPATSPAVIPEPVSTDGDGDGT